MALRERTGAVVLGGLGAAVLSAGAVAWACTPYESGSEAAAEYQAHNPPPSQDRSATQPQPAPQPQSAAQPAPQPQPQSQPQPASEPAPVAAPAKAAAPAASAPAPASARPSRVAGTATSNAVRRPVRPAAVATAAAPAAPAPAAPAPAPADPAPVASPVPSMGSVSGDLWGGFAPGPDSSTRGPSLATSPVTGSGQGSEWALGVGLLGAGLVALGAGTGVSVVRRARVRAGGQWR